MLDPTPFSRLRVEASLRLERNDGEIAAQLALTYAVTLDAGAGGWSLSRSEYRVERVGALIQPTDAATVALMLLDHLGDVALRDGERAPRSAAQPERVRESLLALLVGTDLGVQRALDAIVVALPELDARTVTHPWLLFSGLRGRELSVGVWRMTERPDTRLRVTALEACPDAPTRCATVEWTVGAAGRTPTLSAEAVVERESLRPRRLVVRRRTPRGEMETSALAFTPEPFQPPPEPPPRD